VRSIPAPTPAAAATIAPPSAMILSSERCRRTRDHGRSKLPSPSPESSNVGAGWAVAARAVSAPARRGPAEPALQSRPGWGWRPVSQSQHCWPEAPHEYGAFSRGRPQGSRKRCGRLQLHRCRRRRGPCGPRRADLRGLRGDHRGLRSVLERPYCPRATVNATSGTPTSMRAGRAGPLGPRPSRRFARNHARRSQRCAAEVGPVGGGCLAGSSQNGHVRPAPLAGHRRDVQSPPLRSSGRGALPMT
jgi:hypothetical protein